MLLRQAHEALPSEIIRGKCSIAISLERADCMSVVFKFRFFTVVFDIHGCE